MTPSEPLDSEPILARDPASAAFADVALADAGPGTFTYRADSHPALAPGCLVVAPLGSRRLPGLVVRLHRGEPEFPTRPLLGLLHPQPVLHRSQLDLARWIARTYRASVWDSLCLMLPPTLPARLARRGALDSRRLAAWLERLLEADPSAAPGAAPAAPPLSEGPPLTESQRQALEPLARAVAAGEQRAFLLHGVTGSGKTHVYLQAAEQVIAGGGQVLVLVSEIALTPEAAARFSARFPERVAVLHSKLTDAQRDHTWARIRAGDVSLVVGSRSAIFAPTQRLRLIVLDEEHEWTYKQETGVRYHARAVALARARDLGACVVLSSATPDVSTYYRALQGRFQLLSLSSRYRPLAVARSGPRVLDGRPALWPDPAEDLGPDRPLMPQVAVVDLRRELREGNRSIFSRALAAALVETFERGEQAILFLNRRGAATCVTCRDCGHTLQCRRCELPLAYHRGGAVPTESAPVEGTGSGRVGGSPDAPAASLAPASHALVCHRCNRRRPLAPRCPRCGSARIRFLGWGTQRVEQEVRTLLPVARVQRWDQDAVPARGAHERLWRAFADGEVDVLVGTQMVAKALDVPRVTLVGAVLADSGLYLPDFRATERTFQLLTQVAGRAGRGSLAGRAIIQTYAAEHYAIRAAAGHDYAAFYAREIAFRRQFGYPPFRRLAKLVFSDSNDPRCWRETTRVRRLLADRLRRLDLVDLEVLGPAPCFYRRVRGRYRWQILLCGEAFERVLDELPLGHGWVVDIDPVNVL